MEGFLKADIFFFVTTIAVIFVSIVLVVALVYLVKILRDFLYVSHKVKTESDEIIKDVEAFRGEIKKRSSSWVDLLAFFFNLFKIKKKGRKGKQVNNNDL